MPQTIFPVSWKGGGGRDGEFFAHCWGICFFSTQFPGFLGRWRGQREMGVFLAHCWGDFFFFFFFQQHHHHWVSLSSSYSLYVQLDNMYRPFPTHVHMYTCILEPAKSRNFQSLFRAPPPKNPFLYILSGIAFYVCS